MKKGKEMSKGDSNQFTNCLNGELARKNGKLRTREKAPMKIE